MVLRTVRVLAVLIAATTLFLAPVVHAAEPAAAGATHVVEAGDTLSQIALDAGTDTAALAQLNGLDADDVLSVGQTLKLPGGSSAAPAPAPAAQPVQASQPAQAGAGGQYTVAEGDTLWSIAQQLGTTTDALVEANHLDNADLLVTGRTLVAPGRGASSAGTAAAASASANTAPVSAGPASAASAPASASAGPASAATGAAASSPAAASSAPRAVSSKRILVPYTVQAGETLGAIARQFDVKPDAIAQASGIDDPNRIGVGAVVKVPLPGYEHVVVEGETLRDIARREKVDLGSLIDFNEIDDPELIRVGQVVVVPAPAPNQQVAALGAPTSTEPAPSAPAPASAAPAPAAPAPAAPAPAAPAPAAPAPAAPAPAAPAAAAPATASAPAAAAAPSTAPAPAPAAEAPKPAPAAPANAAPKPAPVAAAPAPAPIKPTRVAVAPADAPRDGLVGAALKLLGAPYVWGGSAPSGFDCSGLVWYAVRQSGKAISRGLQGEYNSGAHPGRDELKPGDLVFFQNTYTPGLSHNGIYIGSGQFVHAADEQSGVTISSLSTGYWSSHWFGATRLP